MIDVHIRTHKKITPYGTVQMRCLQPAAYIESKGWISRVDRLTVHLPRPARLLMLHRGQLDPLTAQLVTLARRSGSKVAADYDDNLFGAEVDATNVTADKAQRVRNLLKVCDIVTVSTPFLKSYVEEFTDRCHVIRNALSKEFLQFAAESFQLPKPAFNDGLVTIGYFSGSAHHDEDFKVVEGDLLRLLEIEPKAKLIVAGKLTVSNRFQAFGNRFEHVPFQPYSEFINLFRSIDINIVPLATSSPIAEGRSELKYIEAGAFGIPTVASPSETYKSVIRSGQNGILCERGEWLGALSNLCGRSEFRRQLGAMARADILSNYSAEARANDWDSFLSEFVQRRNSMQIKHIPSIAHASVAASLSIHWARRAVKRANKGIRGPRGQSF